MANISKQSKQSSTSHAASQGRKAKLEDAFENHRFHAFDWLATPKAKSKLRAYFRDRLRLHESEGKDKLTRLLKRATDHKQAGNRQWRLVLENLHHLGGVDQTERHHQA